MILVIDKHDSFVFNVVRYIEELGAPVRVARNDALDVAGIRALARRRCDLARRAARRRPGCRWRDPRLVGRGAAARVCLGHQCLGAAFAAGSRGPGSRSTATPRRSTMAGMGCFAACRRRSRSGATTR